MKKDNSKTKKKLASLALGFALAAPAFAVKADEEQAAPAPAQSSQQISDAQKRQNNMHGLWKNNQFDIVAEIKDCSGKTETLCSSIYWLGSSMEAKSAASLLTTPRDQGIPVGGDPVPYANLPASAYCGQPLSSDLKLKAKDSFTWAGSLDTSPPLSRGVSVEVTQISSDSLYGKVSARFLFLPAIEREASAWRISPDDIRYPRCTPF